MQWAGRVNQYICQPRSGTGSASNYQSLWLARSCTIFCKQFLWKLSRKWRLVAREALLNDSRECFWNVSGSMQFSPCFAPTRLEHTLLIPVASISNHVYRPTPSLMGRLKWMPTAVGLTTSLKTEVAHLMLLSFWPWRKERLVGRSTADFGTNHINRPGSALHASIPFRMRRLCLDDRYDLVFRDGKWRAAVEHRHLCPWFD